MIGRLHAPRPPGKKTLVPSLVLLLALLPGVASAQWVQLGPGIDGVSEGDSLGACVALSSVGSRVAVGAPWHNGIGARIGYVRVHEWDDGTQMWVQLGSDIDGEADWDFSGSSVALSSDGALLAIGAPYNDGNGGDSGHVRVYELIAGVQDWVQLGQDIDGENGTNHSGTSVALSSDGSRLAVGAPYNDGNGVDSGHVRVHEWDDGTQMWVQLGQDIDGEGSGDASGSWVALTSDGSRLAVGAPLNNGTGGDSGHVRVYEWSETPQIWEQLGSDIDGEAGGDTSGYAVAFSSDGSLLAVGAPYNDGNGQDSGHMRVHEWVAGTQSWQQLGSDIDGEAANDWSGYSGAISSDGMRVAIGASRNDGNGANSGHVRVHKWDGAAQIWEQHGQDIDGDEGDFSGGYGGVALSSDGRWLAVGAPGNDVNGLSSGRVRVYSDPGVIFADGFESGDTHNWSSVFP